MDDGMPPAAAGKEALPDHPELALFVATLFQRLGGKLEIDGAGRRLAQNPHRRRTSRPARLPQLAAAQPWERFANEEEWRGAMKLVSYWLARLSERDREFVFTACADLRIDPASPFDFQDYLQ